MEWVTLIQKAIDYMEEHLLDKINYEDVARQVHMSSYNFHRTFSLMAGLTANEYIRNRRLSLAGQELQLTGIKIIDVAYKYGYETPESFSKAFSRYHGVNPKLATVKGTQLSLFNALVIKIVLEGGKSMDYRVEAVGKRTYISRVMAFRNEIINEEDNNEIPQFWDSCRKQGIIKQMLDMRPQGKKDMYGLCSPTKENEVTFDYGIGILLDEETVAGDEISLQDQGFQLWDVEPAEFVVFKCFGDSGDCISETWSRFFKEFLPQSGYIQAEDTDMEVYYDLEEPGLFCELWIPIEKKTEIN
jgi:AraC family transcriptional regulator